MAADRVPQAAEGVLGSSLALSRRPLGRRVLVTAYSFARGAPLVPLAFLLLVVFCAIFGNAIAPHDPVRYNIGQVTLPPLSPAEQGAPYLLGSDNFGRDILSRIISGSRISVVVAATVIFLAGTVGTILGLVSGYWGKRLDSVIMGWVDMQLAIPSILFAILLVAIFKASLTNVVIVIAFTTWPSYARLIRGEVLAVKEADYIKLAQVAGAGTLRILARHVFPQVVNTLIILATLQVGTVMIFEASLSFLGLGVQPPTPSWGLMLSEGRRYITSAWWLVTFPGVAIMLTVLSANLLGDWLRDRLDPKRRQV